MSNTTSRMLINARNPMELRVALIEGESLQNFKVDVADRSLTRGNIYFGTIANIQPSLNAAFIDYGAEKHGFLPIQDVVPDAYYGQAKPGQRPRIEDVLEKGQPIVVQITREPEGQKGAALTTNLSLAGRYLVLMPFEQTRGISRKVGSDEERRKLRELIQKLDIPEDIGVIVRTNALNQTKTALNRDLTALLRLWKKIGTDARAAKRSKLLYTDQDIVLQALRDYLDSSVEEVLVDEQAAFDKSQEYMNAFMPRSKTKLIRYEERTPLFSKFKIEEQIEQVFERQVSLPSGGSIVIDPTEALTSIDVNSGRSTKASSQEETAVHTNLEAAEEVARQLRLRDIGGLIVVDFIDMRGRRNQSKVEKALRNAMKADKARHSIGRISSNGLVEINRQRLEQAVQLRTHRACPTCDGTGRIESPELVALHLIRMIEARATTGFMKGCSVALHPDLAEYVQNRHRGTLARLEDEFDLEIEIIASPKLHRPERDVTWFARDRNEIKKLEEEQAAADRMAAEFSKAASIAGSADDEEDEQDEDDTDQDGQGSDKPKKKRRRRRGGRRRSRKKNGTNGEDGDDAEADAQEAGDRRKGGGDKADHRADDQDDRRSAGRDRGETRGRKGRDDRDDEDGDRDSGKSSGASRDGGREDDGDAREERQDRSGRGGNRRRTDDDGPAPRDRKRGGRRSSSRADGDDRADGGDDGGSEDAPQRPIEAVRRRRPNRRSRSGDNRSDQGDGGNDDTGDDRKDRAAVAEAG